MFRQIDLETQDTDLHMFLLMDLRMLHWKFESIIKHNIYLMFDYQQRHLAMNKIIHIYELSYCQKFHEAHYYQGIFEHMYEFCRQNNNRKDKKEHKI